MTTTTETTLAVETQLREARRLLLNQWEKQVTLTATQLRLVQQISDAILTCQEL